MYLGDTSRTKNFMCLSLPRLWSCTLPAHIKTHTQPGVSSTKQKSYLQWFCTSRWWWNPKLTIIGWCCYREGSQSEEITKIRLLKDLLNVLQFLREWGHGCCWVFFGLYWLWCSVLGIFPLPPHCSKNLQHLSCCSRELFLGQKKVVCQYIYLERKDVLSMGRLVLHIVWEWHEVTGENCKPEKARDPCCDS